MIAPIGSVTGTFALGGLTTQPRGTTAFGALAEGGTLTALDSGRGGVAQVKAELMKLRDALQAARKDANAVPGGTQFTPIVADIEQTQDKPTFVTVDGQPVQNGTITVSLGTRPVVVGYEVGNRSTLDVRNQLNALASHVSRLVSTVGTGSAGSFASDVSALLKSSDLMTAVNAPDAASIDAAIGHINNVLAKADGLRSAIGSRVAAAAQVDLSGVLISATAGSVATSSSK
jgi:hypothetical protein